MELGEAIRRRRMVRRFTADPVEPEAVERIARAGLSGPSAGFAQGVSLVVLTDRADIETAAADCGEQAYVARGFDPWLSTAGALVVLCVEPDTYRARYSEPDKDPAVLEAVPWWWVDGGAALAMMLLASLDEGLAAGFHGGQRIGRMRQRLGIPEAVEIVGVLAIGHPAPDRKSSSLRRGRRPDTEVLHHRRWQRP